MRPNRLAAYWVPAIGLAALLTLPAATDVHAEQAKKKSTVKSRAKKFAKEQGTKMATFAAQQLAPMVLDRLGIDSPYVNAFFGITEPAETIDYDRIAGIVADAVGENDLQSALIQAKEAIDQEHDNLAREIKGYQDAKKAFDEAKQGSTGAPLTTEEAERLQEKANTIDLLESTVSRIDRDVFGRLKPHEDKGIYSWAAGANLRLGAIVVLHRERGTSWGLQDVIGEVDKAIAKIEPYATLEKRLDYVQCVGGEVVDTFENDRTGKAKRTLTWEKDDCPAMVEQVKEVIRKKEWARPRCDCSDWQTTEEQRARDPRNGREWVIPATRYCSGDDWQLYIGYGPDPNNRISGDWDAKSSCTARRATFKTQASEIYNQGVERADYLGEFLTGWKRLRSKLEYKQVEKKECASFFPEEGFGGEAYEACILGRPEKLASPARSFICGTEVARVSIGEAIVSCEAGGSLQELVGKTGVDVFGNPTAEPFDYSTDVVALGPDPYEDGGVPDGCVDLFEYPRLGGQKHRVCGNIKSGDDALQRMPRRVMVFGVESFRCGKDVESLRVREHFDWDPERSPDTTLLCGDGDDVRASLKHHGNRVEVKLTAQERAARSRARDSYVELLKTAARPEVAELDVRVKGVVALRNIEAHRPGSGVSEEDVSAATKVYLGDVRRQASLEDRRDAFHDAFKALVDVVRDRLGVDYPQEEHDEIWYDPVAEERRQAEAARREAERKKLEEMLAAEARRQQKARAETEKAWWSQQMEADPQGSQAKIDEIRTAYLALLEARKAKYQARGEGNTRDTFEALGKPLFAALAATWPARVQYELEGARSRLLEHPESASATAERYAEMRSYYDEEVCFEEAYGPLEKMLSSLLGTDFPGAREARVALRASYLELLAQSKTGDPREGVEEAMTAKGKKVLHLLFKSGADLSDLENAQFTAENAAKAFSDNRDDRLTDEYPWPRSIPGTGVAFRKAYGLLMNVVEETLGEEYPDGEVAGMWVEAE